MTGAAVEEGCIPRMVPTRAEACFKTTFTVSASANKSAACTEQDGVHPGILLVKNSRCDSNAG